jgi:hypothetical protein
MEGLLFVGFWLGGAILHTFYDLKVKAWLKSARKAERFEGDSF